MCSFAEGTVIQTFFFLSNEQKICKNAASMLNLSPVFCLFKEYLMDKM